MLSQDTGVGELFVANFTRKGSLSRVHTLMPLQAGGVREVLTACNTNERTITGVHPFVSLQNRSIGKRLTTETTHMAGESTVFNRRQRLMLQFVMLHQMEVGEDLAAKFTRPCGVDLGKTNIPFFTRNRVLIHFGRIFLSLRSAELLLDR